MESKRIANAYKPNPSTLEDPTPEPVCPKVTEKQANYEFVKVGAVVRHKTDGGGTIVKVLACRIAGIPDCRVKFDSGVTQDVPASALVG